MKHLFPVLPFAVLLTSCALKHKPEEAIRIALTYADLEWMPEKRHIRHGKDSQGIMVQTPDTTLVSKQYRDGYWKPGKTATGMPYKWGGFDTPESFLAGLAEGKKAGDIATPYKIDRNDSVVSAESVGIDCSGFVSRCWGLSKPVSTRELPEICIPVSWDDLKKGDILLTKGHVILVRNTSGRFMVGYEAGPIPTWRARLCVIRLKWLKENDYSPWRYKNMAEPAALVKNTTPPN
ncbi:MAG: hypothetical protein ACSHX7_10540 [Luteolibacter sp.]